MPERHLPIDTITAVTLLMALIGYEVFAPWMQAFAPESSLPAMVLRLLLLVLCCAAAYKHRSHLAPLSMDAVPMVAFVLLYALRLYENFFVSGYDWEASPDVAFSFLFGACLLPALFLHCLISQVDERRFVLAAWIATILFLLGMASAWEQVMASVVVNRVVMDKLNPISLGYLCSTLLLILLLKPPRKWLATLGWSVCFGLLVIAFAFSQARGQILATAALLPLLLWSQPRADRHRLLLVLALPALGVTWLSLVGELSFSDLVLERFTDAGTDDSASGRQAAWAASWLQFLEHPVLGDKVFEPTLRHYPHNIVLEALIALGIAGAALIVWHLYASLRAVQRVLATPGCGVVAQFVALFALKEIIAAMLSGAIWSDNAFWIGTACVIGLAAHYRRRTRGQVASSTNSQILSAMP